MPAWANNMASGVAEMVIDLVRDGTLDNDLDFIAEALNGRMDALDAQTAVPFVAPAPYSYVPKPPPVYSPGQRVKFKNWAALAGIEATVEQRSTSAQRWIIRPDAMNPYLSRFEMKRYPGCVSIYYGYLEPA